MNDILSFIGYILLTKSLPCKWAIETGMPYLSKVFQNIQSIILDYGNALIWQVLVSQASRRLFPDSWKTLRSLQLSKSQIPSWPSGRPNGSVQTPISVREDSEQLIIDSLNRLDDRATPSRRYLVFEKILNYAADMFGEDS
jgi:hypothetical protein